MGHPDWLTKHDDDAYDPFGMAVHDSRSPGHSGIRGHYCLEFDGLWICEDCTEFYCCTCFPSDKPVEKK